MDGIVPVVIVIGRLRLRVPAAIVGLQCTMRPPVAGVLTADHHPRASEARGPHIIRVDPGDIPPDRLWTGKQRGTRCLDRRLIQLDLRIGVKVRDIRPFGQRLRGAQPTAHPHHVGHPERPPFDAEPVQCLPQRRLGALGMFREGPVDVFALLRLGAERGRAAQIGLLREKHDELGLALSRSVQHPGIDPVMPRGGRRCSDGFRYVRRCRHQRGQHCQGDEEDCSAKHGSPVSQFVCRF